MSGQQPRDCFTSNASLNNPSYIPSENNSFASNNSITQPSGQPQAQRPIAQHPGYNAQDPPSTNVAALTNNSMKSPNDGSMSGSPHPVPRTPFNTPASNILGSGGTTPQGTNPGSPNLTAADHILRGIAMSPESVAMPGPPPNTPASLDGTMSPLAGVKPPALGGTTPPAYNASASPQVGDSLADTTGSSILQNAPH